MKGLVTPLKPLGNVVCENKIQSDAAKRGTRAPKAGLTFNVKRPQCRTAQDSHACLRTVVVKGGCPGASPREPRVGQAGASLLL